MFSFLSFFKFFYKTVSRKFFHNSSTKSKNRKIQKYSSLVAGLSLRSRELKIFCSLKKEAK